MSVILLIALAQAGFPGDRSTGSVVLGTNLVVALGEKPEGGRYGVGIDAGYQEQGYTQRAGWYGDDYILWADEHPAPNRGAGAHVWVVGGVWHSSVAARWGVAWPLRVGTYRGWWPGPGAMGELGVLVSQAGAGLDLVAVVEAPWVQVRTGAAAGMQGWLAPRLHLGAFLPVLPAENSSYGDDLWRRPGCVRVRARGDRC